MDIFNKIAERDSKPAKFVRKATVRWQIQGARSGYTRLFTYNQARKISARYNRMTGLDTYVVRFGIFKL